MELWIEFDIPQVTFAPVFEELARSNGRLPVKEASRLIGLDAEKFGQQFLTIHGMTFETAQLRMRILLGLPLLLYSDLRVSEIADLLGFKSASHFQKTFKQTVGIPPTMCRQRAELQNVYKSVIQSSSMTTRAAPLRTISLGNPCRPDLADLPDAFRVKVAPQ